MFSVFLTFLKTGFGKIVIAAFAVLAAFTVGELSGSFKQKKKQKIEKLESYIETTKKIKSEGSVNNRADADNWLRDNS